VLVKETKKKEERKTVRERPRKMHENNNERGQESE
jgi:hypothetical protein